MHFRKAFGTDVLDQIAGSGAWGQVVRAAVAFIRDPDSDQKTVIMSQAKSNLGPGDLPSKTYTFQPVVIHTNLGPAETSRISWGEDSAWSVEDILLEKNTDKAKGKLDEAIEWLAEYLADGEAVLIETVKRDAQEAGISDATLNRAKARLPMRSRRQDGEVRGKMMWYLDLAEMARISASDTLRNEKVEKVEKVEGDPDIPTFSNIPTFSTFSKIQSKDVGKVEDAIATAVAKYPSLATI
jgi:hypothetical protein